jgi:hypothetical protein
MKNVFVCGIIATLLSTASVYAQSTDDCLDYKGVAEVLSEDYGELKLMDIFYSEDPKGEKNHAEIWMNPASLSITYIQVNTELGVCFLDGGQGKLFIPKLTEPEGDPA